ncbi:FecR domain-containing protein [Dyella sp. A6]|uniref:FecR family protein n=1 Tax=Dyella aluminiiresistens TaxID=3069105 RepID=UPI002E7A9107|nr:FecR domain-containing protein [Dyella sp. A6]
MPAAHAGDWYYRVRPHDNIWTLNSRFLKPGVGWQKLQTYNKVADPYHLVPGSRLRIPVEWLRVQPAKATVIAVAGMAHAYIAGQTAGVVITPGMKLGYGVRIETGPHASLTLKFADDSHVLMQSGSELTLDRMSAYGNTGMADTKLRLQHGRISNAVTPMPGNTAHFVVQTPGAISSVRGTHFRVAAGDDHSQTEVLKGRVDVAGHRRHVQVNRGSGVSVTDGHRPGQVRKLLPAPVLDCPSQPVTHIGDTLSWTAMHGAVHYRVEIAPDARFETLLLDSVTGALPHVSVPDLPNGEHAIRIHGIDSAGLEGLDATCTLRTAMHPQPPLVQQPQAGSKVRDPRPQFRWTESSEAKSYDWQLASDAQFAHVLAERPQIDNDHVRAPAVLPLGRYYWRIASRDAQGNLGPYTDALPFERVAPPPAPSVGAPKSSKHELTLGWSAGKPGQHYRIQLARDAQFTHPLVDRMLDTPSLQMRKPHSGTWYVRVRTIDTDGYAGAWGPVQKFRLPCIPCRIAAIGGGATVLWLLL